MLWCHCLQKVQIVKIFVAQAFDGAPESWKKLKWSQLKIPMESVIEMNVELPNRMLQVNIFYIQHAIWTSLEGDLYKVNIMTSPNPLSISL
jgi:hypothetical protein